ncbi:hypothetical protein M0804_009684 [Polistes exclamans]|nr:hypothetical protein M0804_009684 [Polistes exclamans]
MPKYSLNMVLLLLWKNLQRGISAENSVTEFVSKGIFVFPEVSKATVKYWLKFCNDHSYRFSIENSKPYITNNERLFFLSALIRAYPEWTVSHFMDALKVSRQSIYNYLEILEYDFCPVKSMWCKRMSQ